MCRTLEEQRLHAVPRSNTARVLGRTPLSGEARSWYLGAIGEIRTEMQLEHLDESARVLHSVAVGDKGSDIDHIVVSASGLHLVKHIRKADRRATKSGATLTPEVRDELALILGERSS